MLLKILKQKLSHPKDILFPDDGITKQKLANYYEKIAPFLLPHIKNRPMVLQRFTEDITRPGFYQKAVSSYFPSFLKRVRVPLKTENRDEDLVLLNTAQDLVYLTGQRTICFHAWLSEKRKLNHPTKIVFDLDPSGTSTHRLIPAALALKKILESHGLVPFVMTTGSRGYHVVAPIKPDHDFDTVHAWVKKIAQDLARSHPTDYTTEMSIKKRGNRVFIDYLRNSYAQTGIVPYSLRALPGAPVATPITWEELVSSGMHPQKFTIKNIFRRLAAKGDPWKNFHKSARRLKI